MATYKDILKEKENQNWLKGSLALRITKAGLRDLVEGDSYRVQQKIHSSIIHARNLAPGASCSLCLTENLMRCPTRGLCSNPRNCKYHDSAIKMFQPCRSQICDDFRDEICAVHRYGGPSWKNTKAEQWCTNHWQVAKCFMPPDGYQNVSSFDETDLNGIINFMINCTEIQRSLSFNIANQPNQPNILTKVRQIGHNIRHSPDLKVTDTDIADCFATLNALLTDSTYLASNSYAQQAVVKLKQLQNDTLHISSEDVRELLEEAKAVIEAGKHELLQSVDTSKQEIQDMVSKGKKAVATGKRKIEETVSEGKTAIASGKRQIEEAVFEGKTGIATGKLEIEEMTSQALQRIRDVSSLSNAEQKKDLQQRLAKYYRKHLNSFPISPLLSDKAERLDKFYIPPKIVEKDHRKVGAAGKENGTPVTAYRQLFCNRDEFRKNVFIVGEAGMGKSSCAAMCALKWANQFSSTNTTKDEPDKHASHQTSNESLELLVCCLLNSDLEEMFLPETKQDDRFQDESFYKEIEFLFHLTLRDSCELCDLTDMIRDQLINIIYQHETSDAAYSTMHSVLSNSKCVIIADGLDEWTHPNETNCRCSEKDKVIPYLSPSIDATVIITSRPWRMSQQRVKDTQIDTYLEIEGTADIKLLIQKILNNLNETVTEKKTLLDFVKFVDRMDVTRLLSVPITSMLLVCLWFEGMHESCSVCDIYAYTIEMMLKQKALPVLLDSQQNIPFPRCFQHTEYVQKYYNVVMEIAQLAFTTLFSSDRTSSLVFKKVGMLSHTNLDFALKSGILQETKAASLIRKSSSYSFMHKTVQEFLAAIYMSYHPEECHRILTPFYKKNGHMSDVSQVFIFVCGLNIELANEMSAEISNKSSNYDRDFVSELFGGYIQRLIVSGYKEAIENQMLNVQLSLFSFDFRSTIDTEILNDLLSINKSKVRSIRGSGMSQAKLQEVFSSSMETLTNVHLFGVAGQYDLSTCNSLQVLYITGSETTDIVFNTKRLYSLHLNCVSKTVECSILQSLRNRSETLEIMKIETITNISFFCQTLPLLTNLRRLELGCISNIDYYRLNLTQVIHSRGFDIERLNNVRLNLNMPSIDLGDHALLLPASVEFVRLQGVTMTALSLRGLVERFENSSHYVCCTLRKCIVEPNTEYEEIKRCLQTSENYKTEIVDDGFTFAKRKRKQTFE